MRQLQITAQKFQAQLRSLLSEARTNQETYARIRERCAKGIVYFTDALHDQLMTPIEQHYKEIKAKSRSQKYPASLEILMNDVWSQIEDYYQMTYRSEKLHSEPPKYKRVRYAPKTKKVKRVKGQTYQISHDMLLQGKSLKEIAKERGLSVGTIEGHMNHLLREEKITINKLMDTSRQDKIIRYFNKYPNQTITNLKVKIPFPTTFGELRWIQTYLGKYQVD